MKKNAELGQNSLTHFFYLSFSFLVFWLVIKKKMTPLSIMTLSIGAVVTLMVLWIVKTSKEPNKKAKTA